MEQNVIGNYFSASLKIRVAEGESGIEARD